jgi:hypothetical protein
MNKLKHTDPLIVIIATSNDRTNLLYERSLRSVYEQIGVNPHQIYIVDDNIIQEGNEFSNEYGKIKKLIQKLRFEILKPRYDLIIRNQPNSKFHFENYFHTTLIKNQRTKGFSGTGSWNTAAFKALQYSGRNYFIAILDDDDEWNTKYLKKHFEAVTQIEKIREYGKLKNIRTIGAVSGILRIEAENQIKIKADSQSFTKENFFIGNPGLQGSNLFIDLKTFWTIGGFDESLKSASDRDFAIRLINYVNLRKSKQIKFINKTLVNHYAISQERVTSNISNKFEGLNTFYRKYLHQFPSEIQQNSLQRAKNLFNYILPTDFNNNEEKSQIIEKPKRYSEKLNLVIGTISDNPNNLTELFKTFIVLYNKFNKNLNSYIFIVLENCPDEYKIRPIVDYFKHEKSLNIQLIQNRNGEKSIAENRTYLQNYIYKIGKENYSNNFVSWLIDDDCLFMSDTIKESIIPNYFSIISQNQNKSIDALFGLVSDAPPLPFLSTLRSQLIDFYYSLTYFSHINPDDKFQINSLQAKALEFEEFYYDLTKKSFQHLECPFYWRAENLTNVQAFEKFLLDTSLLANGVNVFRKLTYESETIGKLVSPSIYRGGNTIIFNPEMLKITNYTPEEGYNRRSDFNWSLINKHIFNRNIYEIILPLKHDRQLQKTSLLTNEEKLHADIKGFIFYRVFNLILSQRKEKKIDNKLVVKYFDKLKIETINRIKINNYRAVSLIYHILDILNNKKLWWYNNEYRKTVNYIVQQNIYFLEVMRIELGKRKFQSFINNLKLNLKIDDNFIAKILEDIEEIRKQSTVNELNQIGQSK